MICASYMNAAILEGPRGGIHSDATPRLPARWSTKADGSGKVLGQMDCARCCSGRAVSRQSLGLRIVRFGMEAPVRDDPAAIIE
jgi:hypothetical protein